MSCIEFTGCTGAGKSTLVSHVLQACRVSGIDAWLGEAFVLKQVWLDWTKNEFAGAVIVNLISLLVALLTLRKNLKFYRFAFQTTSQLPITFSEKLYIDRNILKIIGIFEIAHRRSAYQQIVVLDEGPLQIAHLLFVNVAAESRSADLATFIRLVPLPDLAIYLQQDEEVLIERTMARGHKRIPAGSLPQVESFIKRAVTLFKKLAQDPVVKQRLFIVDRDQNIIIPERAPDHSLEEITLKVLRTGLEMVEAERRAQSDSIQTMALSNN